MRQDNRGGGSRGGYRQDRPQTNYSAMTGYYDGERRLRREVFVDWPKEIAISIGSKDERGNNKPGVSRTNLRIAYDFVSSLHFQLQLGLGDEEWLLSSLNKLHRYAIYQANRDNRNWREARDFLIEHIKRAESNKKQFEGFYQLFQSVMAYLRR